MEALLTGKNRRPFLEEVERRFSDSGILRQFNDDLGRAKPDYAWRRIVEELKPIVGQHFGRESDEEKNEYKQERIRLGELLKERAQARQCMAGADADLDGQLDLQLRIARLTYRLRRERRRFHKERSAKLVEGITTALAKSRWSAVWRLCPALSGKGLGPKKRQYRVPSRSSPSASDWESYLSQDGPSGGMQARRIELAEYERCRGEQYGPVVPADATAIFAQAREDLDAARCAMRRAAKRKGWPQWSLAVDVFQRVLGLGLSEVESPWR